MTLGTCFQKNERLTGQQRCSSVYKGGKSWEIHCKSNMRLTHLPHQTPYPGTQIITVHVVYVYVRMADWKLWLLPLSGCKMSYRTPPAQEKFRVWILLNRYHFSIVVKPNHGEPNQLERRCPGTWRLKPPRDHSWYHLLCWSVGGTQWLAFN